MDRMNELALFAGGGGGILGGKLLGWRTVCAVEIDSYARSILLSRQADGCLSPFPIWDDVTTFDGTVWRGRIDVVSGGFPCQDISSARGPGRSGLAGSRSGLWTEFARIISEVQPRYAFIENSPLIRTNGLQTVLSDLAAMGYDASWGVFSAADVGARHERQRMWIVANNWNAHKNAKTPIRLIREELTEEPSGDVSERFFAAPAMGRKVDGVAGWMDRLAALGNGQVPAVAKLAWEMLAPSPDEYLPSQSNEV
jgi:DNA (cytosine-5)-methyltransferase 1